MTHTVLLTHASPFVVSRNGWLWRSTDIVARHALSDCLRMTWSLADGDGKPCGLRLEMWKVMFQVFKAGWCTVYSVHPNSKLLAWCETAGCIWISARSMCHMTTVISDIEEMLTEWPSSAFSLFQQCRCAEEGWAWQCSDTCSGRCLRHCKRVQLSNSFMLKTRFHLSHLSHQGQHYPSPCGQFAWSPAKAQPYMSANTSQLHVGKHDVGIDFLWSGWQFDRDLAPQIAKTEISQWSFLGPRV